MSWSWQDLKFDPKPISIENKEIFLSSPDRF